MSNLSKLIDDLLDEQVDDPSPEKLIQLVASLRDERRWTVRVLSKAQVLLASYYPDLETSTEQERKEFSDVLDDIHILIQALLQKP